MHQFDIHFYVCNELLRRRVCLLHYFAFNCASGHYTNSLHFFFMKLITFGTYYDDVEQRKKKNLL